MALQLKNTVVIYMMHKQCSVYWTRWGLFFSCVISVAEPFSGDNVSAADSFT